MASEKSRIDVTTLVLAFERRISELNKNPPDLVPDKVIHTLLEQAVGEEIKKHFSEVIKIEIKQALDKEFNKIKSKFIKDSLKGILNDESFKEVITAKIKKSIMDSI